MMLDNSFSSLLTMRVAIAKGVMSHFCEELLNYFEELDEESKLLQSTQEQTRLGAKGRTNEIMENMRRSSATGGEKGRESGRYVVDQDEDVSAGSFQPSRVIMDRQIKRLKKGFKTFIGSMKELKEKMKDEERGKPPDMTDEEIGKILIGDTKRLNESSDERMMRQKKKQDFYKHGRWLISLMRGMKGTSLSFAFQTISEFLTSFSITKGMVTQTQAQACTIPGYFFKALQNWSTGFLHQVEEVFQGVKDHREGLKREERDKFLALMSLPEEERRKQEFEASKEMLGEHMRMMGVESNEEDEESTYIDANPETILEDTKKDIIECDELCLETYEVCCKAILGFHSIEVLCGNMKFSVLFSGFDFMKLFPLPNETMMRPSKDENKTETAKTTARGTGDSSDESDDDDFFEN